MKANDDSRDHAVPSLVESMMATAFYPHGPVEIELRQTHIYVFLPESRPADPVAPFTNAIAQLCAPGWSSQAVRTIDLSLNG